MEVKEEDLQYFIGFIGWMTAERLFNGSDVLISLNDIIKYYKVQCIVDQTKNVDEEYIKELGRELLRRKLLKFAKTDNNVYLKLALPDGYI